MFASRRASVGGLGGTSSAAIACPVANTLVERAVEALAVDGAFTLAVDGVFTLVIWSWNASASWVAMGGRGAGDVVASRRAVDAVDAIVVRAMTRASLRAMMRAAGADTESAPRDGLSDADVGRAADGGPGTTRAARHPAPIGNLGIRTHATRHDDDMIHLDRSNRFTNGAFFHDDGHAGRC